MDRTPDALGPQRNVEVAYAEMGQRIFEMMLAAASGEPTKSERHGYGQNEFVPWQVGAVM